MTWACRWRADDLDPLDNPTTPDTSLCGSGAVWLAVYPAGADGRGEVRVPTCAPHSGMANSGYGYTLTPLPAPDDYEDPMSAAPTRPSEGPPDADGNPTWFTIASDVRGDQQWRLATDSPWNDFARGDPPVAPGQWVQVRTSPHPLPTAELWVTDGDPSDRTDYPGHHPVTFAELHATVDTHAAHGLSTAARLDLARAVWRLLTPE